MGLFDDCEEDYYEPTIGDEIFFEARTKLIDSLKQSVKDYVESVRTENEKLKKTNEKLLKQVSNIKSEQQKLEIEKESYRKSLRHEKLSTLMNDFSVVVWDVQSYDSKIEKCDKCDDKRRITFISPSGKSMTENCACDIGQRRYKPRKQIMTEFRKKSDLTGLIMWFKPYENEDGYSSGKAIDRFFDNYELEDMNHEVCDVYFRSEEKCKLYCDYLNAWKESKGE